MTAGGSSSVRPGVAARKVGQDIGLGRAVEGRDGHEREAKQQHRDDG
jgi:hypothetical protein